MDLDVKKKAEHLIKKHKENEKKSVAAEHNEINKKVEQEDEVEAISNVSSKPSEDFTTAGQDIKEALDIYEQAEEDRLLLEAHKKYLKRPFQPWDDEEYVGYFKLLHRIPNITVDYVIPACFDKPFKGGRYAFAGSILRETNKIMGNGVVSKQFGHHRFLAILIEPPIYQEVLERKEYQEIHHFFHWSQVIKHDPIYNDWKKHCAYNKIHFVTHNEISQLFMSLDAMNEPHFE